MIYIIQGNEEYFIRQKLAELCKGYEKEVLYMDGNSKDFSLLTMIDECHSQSLFSDKNFVLVEDPFFFSKKISDNELSILEDYINHPSYETELIFYTYKNQFNNHLKAYKSVSSNARIFDLNSYDYRNFSTYVGQRINEEKLDISKDAILLLENICKRNATLLNQNIEILKLYPERIDTETIRRLCSFSNENEVFDLINALTSKKLSKAIEIERNLLKQNDSILNVVGLLASQLRYLYYVDYLSRQGKKRNEIAKLSNSSDYKVKKAFETLEHIDQKQILSLLYQLSSLDIASKTENSIPDASLFELLILNLLNRETDS